MSVKKSFGKTILIITVFVILMLVITVIGVFFKFTNGFKDEFKTFYVKIDGKLYTESHNIFGLMQKIVIITLLHLTLIDRLIVFSKQIFFIILKLFVRLVLVVFLLN